MQTTTRRITKARVARLRKMSTSRREDFKAATDYAWNWFALHSGQRMQLINFLIISLTLTTAAYATVVSQQKYGVATAIAAGGVLLAIIFQRLDIRTRELVQISEKVLSQIEHELSKQTSLPIDFVDSVAAPLMRYTTYRVSLRLLTGAAIVLYIAGFTYALWEALRN